MYVIDDNYTNSSIEEQLDAILDFLNKSPHSHPDISEPELRERIVEGDIEIHKVEEIRHNMNALLKKLKRDRLINVSTRSIPYTIAGTDITEKEFKHYSINIDGLIFEGYVNRKARLHREKNQIEKVRKTQLVLTLILAAGTAIAAFYYGIEIWKYYHTCRCGCH